MRRSATNVNQLIAIRTILVNIKAEMLWPLESSGTNIPLELLSTAVILHFYGGRLRSTRSLNVFAEPLHELGNISLCSTIKKGGCQTH